MGTETMRKLFAGLIVMAAAVVFLLQTPGPAPAQPADPAPVTPPGITFAREDRIDAQCRTAAVQARLRKAVQDNRILDEATFALERHMSRLEDRIKALRAKPEFAAQAPGLMEALVADGREYDRLLAYQSYLHAVQNYYLTLPACPGDPAITPPDWGIDKSPHDWPDTWSVPPPPPAPLPVPRCRTAATDTELAEVEGKLAVLVGLRDTMIRTYWDDLAKSRAPGANPLLRQNLAREWRKVSEAVEEVQALERRADILRQLKPCATLPPECRTPEEEARRAAAEAEYNALSDAIAAAEKRKQALKNEIDQLDMKESCRCPPPRTGLYLPPPAPPGPPPPPPPPPPKPRPGGARGGAWTPARFRAGEPGVLSGSVLQGVGVENCPPPRTGKEDEPDG
jgi:hypothetical protein